MKLSFKDGRQGKIHIYVDDVYTLTVDDTFWFSEKWHKVNEINDEELADLTLSVNSRRAFLKGAELLSRRAHGKAELTRKLTQKYPRECAEQAADKLEKLGLINDGEFADMLAQELYTHRKYGVSRVKQELLRRGIDRALAEEAAERLDKDDLNRIILLLQTK
ncbi:regulatory protein RecX, partial [human gut metagenome]